MRRVKVSLRFAYMTDYRWENQIDPYLTFGEIREGKFYSRFWPERPWNGDFLVIFDCCPKLDRDLYPCNKRTGHDRMCKDTFPEWGK